MGAYLAFMSVFVIVGGLYYVHDRYPPAPPPAGVDRAAIVCWTVNCHRPATTIAAGRLACRSCAEYLTSRTTRP